MGGPGSGRHPGGGSSDPHDVLQHGGWKAPEGYNIYREKVYSHPSHPGQSIAVRHDSTWTHKAGNIAQTHYQREHVNKGFGGQDLKKHLSDTKFLKK